MSSRPFDTQEEAVQKPVLLPTVTAQQPQKNMRAQAQAPASRLPQGAQPTIAKPKPKPRRPTDYLMKDLISPDGGYKGAKASIAQSDPTKSVRILPAGLTFSTQLLGDVVNACVLDPRNYPHSHSYDGVRRTLDVKLGTLKGKVRPALADRVKRETLHKALCKALGICKGVKYQRQSPDMELIYRIELCIRFALLYTDGSDDNIRHPCIDGFMPLVCSIAESDGNTLLDAPIGPTFEEPRSTFAPADHEPALDLPTNPFDSPPSSPRMLLSAGMPIADANKAALQMPAIPGTSEPCSPALPPLFGGGVLEQHPTRFERAKLT